MKTIGEVRQLRLRQFIQQSGLSYADVNERLGRNRRDATLNQVAQAAKNTRTGKPRRMGDTQARLIETTFKIPEGWFDTDPVERPDLVIVAPDGKVTVVQLKQVDSNTEGHYNATFTMPELVAMEQAARPYGWPFETVSSADVAAMAPDARAALERVMLAFMGSATAQADWRTVGLNLASKLDRDHHTDNFTLFVRAIETELARPVARTTNKAQQP